MMQPAHNGISRLPNHLAIRSCACINTRLSTQSCAQHSSLIAPYCLIQSLAKHNQKPTQLTEDNHQRPKSIASFCRVFRNSRASSDDLTSIVILPALSDFAKGGGCRCLKPAPPRRRGSHSRTPASPGRKEGSAFRGSAPAAKC